MSEIRWIAPEPMHAVVDRKRHGGRGPAQSAKHDREEAREDVAAETPEAAADGSAARAGGIDVLA